MSIFRVSAIKMGRIQCHMFACTGHWKTKSFLSHSSSSVRKDYGAIVTESQLGTDFASKPVILILGWVGSKDKHLAKYSNFLNDQGFSTVAIPSYTLPTFFTTASKGKQISYRLIDTLLEMNCKERPVVSYSFSNGGCALFYLIQKALSEAGGKYHDSLNIVGSIFDSCPVEPSMRSVPVAQWVMTNPIQNPILKSLAWYSLGVAVPLSLYTNSATKDFWSGMMTSPLTCPQMFLYSKTDKLVPYEGVDMIIEARKARGVHVASKCWEDSGHVNHLRDHPVEYMEVLNNFIHKDLKL